MGILECHTCISLTQDWPPLNDLLLKRMQVELERILDSCALFLLLKWNLGRCRSPLEISGASTVLILIFICIVISKEG